MGITAEDLENEEIDILALGETAESISRFGLGIRDESVPNHWRKAKEDLSFKNKKTILILPGSGTSSAEQANGMCKIVQKMLPEDKKNNFQICSMYYPNGCTMCTPTVIRAEKLLDNYIVPLIATKDKNGDLHRISAAKAAHNLRNLMVVTHCYGGAIQRELDSQLNRIMYDLGYLEDERKFIQKQQIVVQHNNIENILGEENSLSTNFIRMSSTDEKMGAADTALGTFYNYLVNNQPQEDDVLYIKLTDNSRVVMVKSITKQGVSDHNGGYWAEAKNKTSAGQKEEQLFTTIFQEAALSSYLIENAEQIVRNAVLHYPQQKAQVTEALSKGKVYGDNYHKHTKRLQAEYSKAQKQIEQDKFGEKDFSKDTLLLQKGKDEFLLDTAIAKNKYKAAENISEAMFDVLPKLVIAYNSEDYKPLPQSIDEEKALRKIKQWSQQAIDLDLKAMFKTMFSRLKVNEAAGLDFANASPQIMSAAVHNISTREVPKDPLEYRNFLQTLTNIYAKAEHLPEGKDKSSMLNKLNNRVLFLCSKSNKEYGKVSSEVLQQFSRKQNATGMQKILQSCNFSVQSIQQSKYNMR